MIQQTVFPFKIEMTKKKLTAYGGLALMAEFNHGIGLRELVDRYLPVPGVFTAIQQKCLSLAFKW